MYIYHTKTIKVTHPDGHEMEWSDSYPKRVHVIVKKDDNAYKTDGEFSLSLEQIDALHAMALELRSELIDSGTTISKSASE